MMMRVPVTQPDDRRVIFLMAMWLLVSCETAPTVIRQSDTPAKQEAVAAADVLALEPVILDVRSPLDFGVSHVPGSVNVHWTDFTQPGAREKGLLDSDHFGLARRLALWGIDPGTPVLVIGDGPKAHGEEAWVAWMLRVLGVKTVHVGTPNDYRGQIPRDEGPPKNKPMWKPRINDRLIATPAEGRLFLRGPSVSVRSMSKARSKALSGAPLPPESARKRVVLDVRSPNEIEALPVKLFGWQNETVKIPWRNFFTPDAQPSRTVLAQLSAAGLDGTEDILVISEIGREAGAVTFALEKLGFGRPQNLSAGLRGLESGK